jgi:hypothetical protein
MLTLPTPIGHPLPIKAIARHVVALSAACLFVACGENDSHDHGAKRDLGRITVGAHTFNVEIHGDVTPGGDLPLNLNFPAGTKQPDVIRAWIGVESGAGATKVRLGRENDHTAHNHIEIPKELPAGSKLWVEIKHDGANHVGSIPLD